jgi:hypothetical protein
MLIEYHNDNDKYLDLISESHPFRRAATHLIIKLADCSGQLPSSLYVEDVTLVQDRRYHRIGGYADVYKGSSPRLKDCIAIKKPRGDDSAHQVRCNEN